MSKIYYDITGQKKGIFTAKTELLSELKNTSFKQIGFETKKDNIIVINEKPIQIGITERIEYTDIQINSCYLQEEGFIIITYIYEKEVTDG